MKCTECCGKTSVIDTRETSDGSTRRRVKCLSCKHRFTTLEYTDYELEDRDLNILKEVAGAFNEVYTEIKASKKRRPSKK